MARKSIAQIFSTNGSYVPTKCAVHLRNVGDAEPAFDVTASVPAVIDATNFRSRTQGTLFTTFSTLTGDTGSGHLFSLSSGASSATSANAPSVSYPVKTTLSGRHYLYVRGQGTGTVEVYVDNHFVGQVVFASGSWGWSSSQIVIADTEVHNLALRFINTSLRIDKLYLGQASATVTGDGPDHSQPPYVTIHGRLATVSAGVPNSYYNQSWAINTYDNVRKEGWYNFDTSLLFGTPVAGTSYAFVVTVSGASDLHYVIWDTADEVENPVAYNNDGVWTVDATTSMTIRVYASVDSLDEINCIITTPDATLETEAINDFEPASLRPQHDNTVLVNDAFGGNDVRLDVNEKILTLILDQSGSNTWNDSTGLRHQFAANVVDALDAKYPADVRLNLLKVNGEPAFSFFIPLTTKITSNDVSEIIRESFRGKPDNFAGFRVVRNPDHYPTTAIDGEIVHDGYALAALDIDLSQNTQYYYTVYTYDHFDRFSDGVQIPVKTNIVSVPRGIPTFETKVALGYDAVRTTDALAMWHMDESEGNYAYDFSDSQLALTLTDTRWLSEYDAPTGVHGLRINGSNSKAQSVVTDKMAFTSVSTFTVSGWLYPFATNTNSCVLARSDTGKFNWAVIQNGLTLQLRIGGVTGACTTPLVAEQWTQFVIKYNGTSASFYLGDFDTAPALVNAASMANGSPNVTNQRMNVGYDPSGTAVNRYFGKVSHVHVFSGTTIATADLAFKTRYTALGTPPGKIAPDNGDRVVIVNFDVPTDFDYNLIRVVRNHVRMPYHETDGTTVLQITPTAGRHSYGLSANYDLDSDYWFRIFTQNAVGNWCPIEDSVGYKVHIPDQDRPHIIVSCGAGCVYEINPGPGTGTCDTPTLTTKAGNQKVHIKWATPADAACTLVKIYYASDKYVVYNNRTKWIVNSESSEGTHVEPIFVGPASVGEFVHRNIPNRQTGFYTVVFAAKDGKHSVLANADALVPLETADDSGIPLLEALDVAYHIEDYDRIRITWNSPVTISSGNVGWFDDKFYFYGAICNLYGQPLSIDYPDDVKIITSVSDVDQSNVEDVFNPLASADSPERIPKATFAVNASGIISGIIRLRSSPLFSVLQSISIGVSAEYGYSETFKWNFPSSTVTFKTPLEMRLVNRDNLFLPTGDYTDPACENPYESGGSDVPRSPYRFRVNGTYIRRHQPFTTRAIFTYKGRPLRAATVAAKVFDATGGPCDIQTTSLRQSSKTLTFTTNSFAVKTQMLPVTDDNGLPTGVEELTSYADIPMRVPQQPQSGRLYVRVQSAAFQSVKRMNIFYPTTLRLSLSATAPSGTGADRQEQFARAWFVDPDYPRDESKIQIVPDLSIIKWTLTKENEQVRKVPFYSTDSVPLVNGVYSYTRSGTARQVFFGPAKSGSEGKYKLTASITVNGLTATREAELEIVVPGSGGYDNYIPEPDAPRIFCEMDECINYLWADGEDYVKMRIFRNPGDSTKTLIGAVQAKYATTFRSCSVATAVLPIGQVVTVNAPGYEIIWGAVEEIIDEYTGLKSLNTEGAFNALDTADITIGRDNYYEVYFRKDAQIAHVGCSEVDETNCCGFDMAERVCADPYEIGEATGVVVSTRMNISGQYKVIFGGGPIGDDNVARPPCVLVPKEPLTFDLVGIFVNNNAVEEVVVDGASLNELIFEVKYRGRPVPAGVPVDVHLVVNIDGEDVEKIGEYDIYTYFGVPKTTYSYADTSYPGVTNSTGAYSFCSIIVNPIPTDKNVAIGIGVSTIYNGTLGE